MSPSVLVAGVGNIFLGDDGFGVEVAQRLSGTDLGPEAFVKDFGISSVHLAFELLNGYEYLVLIDAIELGNHPGTLSLIEIDQQAALSDTGTVPDAHTMNPTTVLKMLEDFGGNVGKVFVVGCEPEGLKEEISLSDAVAGAIPSAIDMVRELVSSLVEPELYKEESK